MLFYSSLFSSTFFRLLCGGLKRLNGAPHIRKSLLCELLLLGYIILQMPRRKKWDPERMKAAVEAMRNKEMGS